MSVRGFIVVAAAFVAAAFPAAAAAREPTVELVPVNDVTVFSGTARVRSTSSSPGRGR